MCLRDKLWKVRGDFMVKEYNDLIEAVDSVKSKKAVIFDMDGLIFDTERVFMEQLAVAMKEHGYTLTRDIYTNTLGLGGKQLVNFMYSEFGSDYPFEECGSKAQERMAIISDTIGLSVKPQIRELLEKLKADKIKCGVASSTKTELVNRYLGKAGLDEYFDVIIGGEQVMVSKPEPDIFICACERLNVSPGKALVLEDSENGIRAAKAAGIPVICVPDIKEPSKECRRMVTAIVRR